MYRYNARSYWNFVKLKNKIAVYKRMYRKVLRKLQKKELQAYYRASDSFGGDTGPPLLPEVTISSQTETGQAEESIKVPKQRAYTGREPVVPSSLADTLCSSLGIQGFLGLLNATLGTSYTLDSAPPLSSVLKDCIAQNYDFGTAYGRLRSAWCDSGVTDIQMELQKREAEDINRRRNALVGSRIVKADTVEPRRVWDLHSNRVVPWWSCEANFTFEVGNKARPISHAWVDKEDRIDVWTPINGYEWPVPIPKGANLDLIRIEMLNLGLEYTWLDVLCLRQRGGPREDLRVEEWKLDVPTIGAIYKHATVVCYLSGLGLPLSLKEGDLESDQCWFRRAWTVQEVGGERIIAGDTPDGPMNAEPIDEAGNYEDKILTRFHKQLESAEIPFGSVYHVLSAMQDRISTNPVDKVAGLAFSLWTRTIPAYYESQSLEDAWTALINEMKPIFRGQLFFAYPEPGIGCQKWRPSWKQVMTKSLPKDSRWTGNVKGGKDDWCKGLHIEKALVLRLAVGGVEGIDRCGELVVEDADGTAHAFNILASHQYPIPEGTYTLLGSDPVPWYNKNAICSPQYWVIGRRLPSRMFEKVSVFTMTDLNEIKRLMELGLSAKSRSILA
ncbi:hypothetical protein ARMGADRAFT_1059136 [Armillaria gallica]|uniref:Heterokaryon incompatibility domain-containing protein n=1 Tax=Armillaria gallica TaxID=47427 RepID=A0A2H3ERD1_ARMGA|nr:hypothetical protein ARMGADRAFT_1059136 [Armillaria gallica]